MVKPEKFGHLHLVTSKGPSTINFHHAWHIFSIKRNTHLLHIVFEVLKVLLIKTCKMHSLYLLFLAALLDFISADTIFHYFLELYATSVKKIFVKNFPFLTDSLNPPHPFNDQNLLSLKKVFCQCSLLPKGLIFDYACQAPPPPPLNLPHHSPFFY